MNDVFIWWVDQSACEAIGDRLSKSYPAWLRDQYDSRYGRSGRGRLWSAERFGEVRIKPWPGTIFADWLGDDFGGIVVDKAQAIKLQGKMPGVVTDTKLQIISLK